MPITELPYPGFSWSLSQHTGPVTDPTIMYELLLAASVYADDPDYREKITQHFVDNRLLTPNYRRDAGRAQMWRDYQQVLPELGLIVSTKFTAGITVTPVGLMWLDGLIGYSELITTQCLGYQYPNGHKQDISLAVQRALTSASIQIPNNRVVLDSLHGVQIKPAVLMLRILLELVSRNDANPTLNTAECAAALLPIKVNRDWPLGLRNITELRSGGIPPTDSRSRRHIAEWFRLLTHADLFEVDGNRRLSLSDVAHADLDGLNRLCEYHEDPNSFWVPETDDKSQLALSWFAFFGSPDIDSQWLIPTEQVSEEYIETNYPKEAKVTAMEDIAPGPLTWSGTINPQAFSTEQQEAAVSQPGVVDPQRVAEGIGRWRESSRLHDRIVRLVAERLDQNSFMTAEDPNSVDIIATKDNAETILEVKTVTRRNIQSRVRLGVGQLSEYRFRRETQNSARPSGILVLSSTEDFPEWIINYFEQDIRLGLVSMQRAAVFKAHTHGAMENLLAAG